MMMMAFGFVLVAAAFLWLIGATVLSVGRKKFFGLAIAALLIGLMTGFLVAWEWYIPEFRAALGGTIRSIEYDQFLATTVSYAALTKLENGKEAEAKSVLATQIVGYYRQLKNAQRLSLQHKKMLDFLEAGIAKSQTLREKSQEPEPH
jgi:hypothetical protein